MIKRILVPLDGSPLAEGALDAAIEMATALKGNVTLLRVVPPAVPGRFYAPHMLDELREAQVREAEAYLDEAKERLKDVPVDTHVLTGEVAKTVVDFAGENQSDLIAMSSHGLGGRGWQVFGSVAQKVLHSASQPVLIVRPPKSAWEREEEEEEERDDEAMLNELARAGTQRQASS